MGSGSDGANSGSNTTMSGNTNASSTNFLVDTNPIFPHTVDEVDLNQRCREAKYEGKDNSVSTSKGPARSQYSNMERTFFEWRQQHPAIRSPGGLTGFVN
jgi:hypothetical protein